MRGDFLQADHRKLYFDFMVMSYIINDNELLFPKHLVSLVTRDNFIVLSPAHIEELCVPLQNGTKNMDYVRRELGKMCELTAGLSIGPAHRRGMDVISRAGAFGAHFHKECPFFCFNRVWANIASNRMAERGHEKFSIRSADTQVRSREVNGQDPIRLLGEVNSKSEIMAYYRDSLLVGSEFGMAHGVAGADINDRIVRALIERGPQDPANSYELIKFNHLAVQSMIESVLKFLISKRYYAESAKKSRSDMHDITHAIYASYCDFFVTNDVRFFHRCRAAFDYLGVPSKVIMLADFVKSIGSKYP